MPPEGARIGYDPWLHTTGWVEAARKALAEKGAELVAVDTNPVDAVWPDQPAPSRRRAGRSSDERYAGRSSRRQARRDRRLAGRAARLDAAVISALDSIAWLLNIRGADVERTPVALSYVDRSTPTAPPTCSSRPRR